MLLQICRTLEARGPYTDTHMQPGRVMSTYNNKNAFLPRVDVQYCASKTQDSTCTFSLPSIAQSQPNTGCLTAKNVSRVELIQTLLRLSQEFRLARQYPVYISPSLSHFYPPSLPSCLVYQLRAQSLHLMALVQQLLLQLLHL